MTIDDTDVALTEAAPSEDATQSIHAWSQTDDDDTELAVMPHRRSWKLPVACAIVALATIGAVGITLERPHHAAAPAKAAPAPQVIVPVPAPVVPETPDQKFVAILKAQGWVFSVPDTQVADEGRGICRDMSNGNSFDQEVSGVATGSGIEQSHAIRFITTATDIYCPQYAR